MKRRVVRTALGAAALALVIFLIPLAIVAVVLFVGQTRVALEHDALSSLLTVGSGFATGDQVELPEATGTTLGVYGMDGALVGGSGPASWDPVTAAAAGGAQSEGSDGSQLVVAVPVSGNESVIGVVRAARPWSTIVIGAVVICLSLIALAAVVLVVTYLFARREAAALSAPIERLAATADALGDGELVVEAVPSGIPEVDEVQHALVASGARLHDVLERERRVAANASHQLRTPLAGMRASLETSLARADGSVTDAATAAIATIDDLDATIDDVLALTRGAAPDAPTAPIAGLIDAAVERWRPRFADRDRPLRNTTEPGSDDARGPRAMIEQVLDILLDNSLAHGAGATNVMLRDAGEAAAIDVTDQGAVRVEGDVFTDGVSSAGGSGLGLGIAARAARDHDAVLLLASTAPVTRFTLLVRQPS